MNTLNTTTSTRQISIKTPMEWNVLQVAIDDMIMDLEDMLNDEELEERSVIEERLAAANSLKDQLSEDF
jgi:hypothetical protein